MGKSSLAGKEGRVGTGNRGACTVQKKLLRCMHLAA